MHIFRSFNSFNHRRYGNPWIAKVNKQTAKIDFSQKIGSYSGGYQKGEAGDLYLYDEPALGDIFAYGQKDYRGNGGFITYIKYTDVGFVEITSKDLVRACQDGAKS